MTYFSTLEQSQAKATCRSTGAGGLNAVVPRYVRDLLEASVNGYGLRVLDFGCGSTALHVDALNHAGFSCDGWDFHGGHYLGGIEKWMPGNELDVARGYYDLAYASNVLNVQISRDMLRRTLGQLRALGCTTIANYPATPCGAGPSVKEMELELFKAGFMVQRVDKAFVGSNVVWSLM